MLVWQAIGSSTIGEGFYPVTNEGQNKRKKITQKFAYQDFFYIFVKLKNKAGWWPKTPEAFQVLT
jgi:hypothetical protein